MEKQDYKNLGIVVVGVFIVLGILQVWSMYVAKPNVNQPLRTPAAVNTALPVTSAK